MAPPSPHGTPTKGSGDLTDDIAEQFTESYRGHFDSVEEFAEEMVDESGWGDVPAEDIPEGIKCYLDYEKIARDMVCGGDIYTVEADGFGVYVFWSH